MGGFFHAVATFFHHLAAVGWTALGIALVCHYLRVLSRTPAWRNILRASYPDTSVPWRSIYGAYVAGVAINSILPARSGDLLKLYLAKRRIDESTYPTLGATLIPETLFDSVVGGAVLAWALATGVLPSLHFQKVQLPQIDWSWPLRNPVAATAIATLVLVALTVLAAIGIRRAKAFRNRVRQGFAILGDRLRYLREVVSWQTLSWLLRGLSVYWFLRAFHVPATAHNALLVLAVQSISTLLPFTPGGVGTQQGLLVYVFKRSTRAISETSILSFSVGMYVAVTASNLVVGFAAIFVMLRTLHWRRLIRPEQEKAYAREP